MKPIQIVRPQDIDWTQVMDQGRFSGRRKGLGQGKLVCAMWELPPGKRSFPLHFHHVTEEAMYVLSGHAKVRTPEGEHAIGPGDFVAFPAGGVPHQLINDGSEPLIYLAMSAGQGFDLVEYPDSGKIACAVGQWPDAKRFVFREKDQAGYFDGEEG